jgi:hypothetical protein
MHSYIIRSLSSTFSDLGGFRPIIVICAPDLDRIRRNKFVYDAVVRIKFGLVRIRELYTLLLIERISRNFRRLDF